MLPEPIAKSIFLAIPEKHLNAPGNDHFGAAKPGLNAPKGAPNGLRQTKRRLICISLQLELALEIILELRGEAVVDLIRNSFTPKPNRAFPSKLKPKSTHN